MVGVRCWVVVCFFAAFSMPLAQASLERNDGFDACAYVSEIAKRAMTARQAGLPLDENYRRLLEFTSGGMQTWIDSILDEAYYMKIGSEYMQQRLPIYFEKRWRRLCVEVLATPDEPGEGADPS